LAQLPDSRAEAVIEIHEGIGGPQLLPQFLARHRLAGTLQQQAKDLEGLLLNLDPESVFAQVAGAQVGLERSEANGLMPGGRMNGDLLPMERV
jgi:hypothetical protein